MKWRQNNFFQFVLHCTYPEIIKTINFEWTKKKMNEVWNNKFQTKHSIWLTIFKINFLHWKCNKSVFGTKREKNPHQVRKQIETNAHWKHIQIQSLINKTLNIKFLIIQFIVQREHKHRSFVRSFWRPIDFGRCYDGQKTTEMFNRQFVKSHFHHHHGKQNFIHFPDIWFIGLYLYVFPLSMKLFPPNNSHTKFLMLIYLLANCAKALNRQIM